MITQFLSNVIVCGVLNLLLEVINGLEQSSLEWHLHTEHSTSQCMHTYIQPSTHHWVPLQYPLSSGNVRLSLIRIILIVRPHHNLTTICVD